jgi:hypothetical protein
MSIDKTKDQRPETKEERLDEGIEETFPASDPPAQTREPQPGDKDPAEKDANKKK